jgi:hypothetical protein
MPQERADADARKSPQMNADGPGSRVRHQGLHVRRSPASCIASEPPVPSASICGDLRASAFPSCFVACRTEQQAHPPLAREQIEPHAPEDAAVRQGAARNLHQDPMHQARMPATRPARARTDRTPYTRKPRPPVGAPGATLARTPCTRRLCRPQGLPARQQPEAHAPEDAAVRQGAAQNLHQDPMHQSRRCPPPHLTAPQQTEPHAPEDLARPSGHRAKPAPGPHAPDAPMPAVAPARAGANRTPYTRTAPRPWGRPAQPAPGPHAPDANGRHRTCPRESKQNPIHQNATPGLAPADDRRARSDGQHPMHQKSARSALQHPGSGRCQACGPPRRQRQLSWTGWMGRGSQAA